MSQVTDKLYHIMLYTSSSSSFELTTSVEIGTDCIGSCKSNYHTSTTTTAPTQKRRSITNPTKNQELTHFNILIYLLQGNTDIINVFFKSFFIIRMFFLNISCRFRPTDCLITYLFSDKMSEDFILFLHFTITSNQPAHTYLFYALSYNLQQYSHACSYDIQQYSHSCSYDLRQYSHSCSDDLQQ
jgi:hypothetical protein